MKTKQLSNSARVLLLVMSLIILTTVTRMTHPEMIKGTYSPYKCSLNIGEPQEVKFNLEVISSLDKLIDYTPRKFNFDKQKEQKKFKEEVRLKDVTSSNNFIVLVIKDPHCEHSVYKII